MSALINILYRQLKTSIAIVFCSLMLICCRISQPKVEHKRLDRYLKSSTVLSQSHSGLIVCDPKSERILIEHNGDNYFTPASNVKLLTYFAGVQILGDSIPGLAYCVSNDTLYFSGTGDPSFLHPAFPAQKVYDVLSTTDHVLAYQPATYSDPRFGPGWAWDDYPYYFSTERSSFPIYGNTLQVSQNSEQDRVRIVPSCFDSLVEIEITSDLITPNLAREEHANRFELSHNGSLDSLSLVCPFRYSTELFLRMLEDTIHKPILIRTDQPSCTYKTLHSQPIDSIMKNMLIPSDNFLAEQILVMCSSILGDTLSGEVAIEHVLKDLIPELESEIRWIDGSGLSRYNLATPHAIVRLLQKIYQTVPEEALFELLPKSGVSGTLKKSFISEQSYIIAKTGSMSYVYNLSGFLLCKSGRILIFSFMNNNFNVSFGLLKEEMHKILLEVSAHY